MLGLGVPSSSRPRFECCRSSDHQDQARERGMGEGRVHHRTGGDLIERNTKMVLENRRKKKKIELPAGIRARPEVIVDFDYEEGLLFASISNVGGASAYAISVKFDKKVG